MSKNLSMPLMRRQLVLDEGGHNVWREVTEERTLAADRVAVIVCDMWDNHWSRGAAERVTAMAPLMNDLLVALRQAGALIIHAPSDTMDAYADAPARQRMLAIPPIQTPPDAPHADPPLPIDDTDQGSDTNEPSWYHAWSRQIAAIEIDDQRDLISDNGAQVYAALQAYGIKQVLIMGVHTNMCVLRRSFAIKQMVRWGVPIALVRDMTDTMYNPAKAPYVDHAEGTRLVCDFIAAHWCPTTTSQALLAALS